MPSAATIASSNSVIVSFIEPLRLVLGGLILDWLIQDWLISETSSSVLLSLVLQPFVLLPFVSGDTNLTAAVVPIAEVDTEPLTFGLVNPCLRKGGG